MTETAAKIWAPVYYPQLLPELFGLLEGQVAESYTMQVPNRAPGSGTSADLIAHHQGIYQLAGGALIVGSAKENPGYLYAFEDNVAVTQPDGNDYVSLDYVMTHPGGIQAALNLLAIGNEQYQGAGTRQDRSNIHFYDISYLDDIRRYEHMSIERRGEGQVASAIGLTCYQRTTFSTLGEDQWILAVRGATNIDFYRMQGDPGTAASPTNNEFELFGSVPAFDEYQCINLFIQADGRLYMFGMNGDGTNQDDNCALFEILVARDPSTQFINEIVAAKPVTSKHFVRDTNGPRFHWASCMEFDVSSVSFSARSASAHVLDGEITCDIWYHKLDKQ